MSRTLGGRMASRSPLEAAHEMGDPVKREKYRQHLLKQDPQMELGEIGENDRGLFGWLLHGGDYNK